MNSIRYILYFVISFVLQLLWFFLSNAIILDMLMMSLLFTLFMFILDKFLKKKQAA